MTLSFQIGDKVTFTEAYRAQIHDRPREPGEPIPTWVDQVCTIVSIANDEWMHYCAAPGWEGTAKVGKLSLVKAYDPDIEALL
jgi:hypothetical protein